MAALKSFFLNGLLSVMDMKQQLMMGTEMANCCGHQTLYSPRSLSVPPPPWDRPCLEFSLESCDYNI